MALGRLTPSTAVWPLTALLAAQPVPFLLLPPEHDPDSFVREKGRDAFNAALEEAMPLSEFLLAELRRGRR